jgi:hypothetical protein
LLTQWAAEKAIEAAGGIPVRRPVCWQKVVKPETREIQVTRGLFEDAKVKGKNS